MTEPQTYECVQCHHAYTESYGRVVDITEGEAGWFCLSCISTFPDQQAGRPIPARNRPRPSRPRGHRTSGRPNDECEPRAWDEAQVAVEREAMDRLMEVHKQQEKGRSDRTT